MEELKITSLLDLSQTEFADIFESCEYPFEILKKLGSYIIEKGPRLDSRYKLIKENVWVGEGTTIADSCSIAGPAIIGCNCEIRHNAFIRGNAVIGNKCVIGNSTEVKNSFLFNSVQAPHFNYVGDSVMGYKSHIGAGVILSNVKSVPGTVSIRTAEEIIETGLRKFSSVLGDHVEVGCNSVLNPGTIVGKGTVIYPLTSARGFIPENHIVKNDGRKFSKRI
ncbi:MAG TPA: UDP-N-acetylglucosamine pyrophosphorylase [bacterium]|nr:UDP-N-acetylglucosamine pyrophosphorylase [bacterium]HPM47521.1 UDP-N-acetylglucosamine pyrophosphorylase [bacterium]HQM83578.1 UDP-N-acetylglucosamine pyrophosphorylase [bacterium]HRQ69562.1 UDP-N-acetylglucosamine pyrophosphorylase [bacterium]